MESPLSKVSRDMERLNQSLARIKAADLAVTSDADVNMSIVSQASLIQNTNNKTFSTLASPLSPVPFSSKLDVDENDTKLIPQSNTFIPPLDLFSSLNKSISPGNHIIGEELMQARALAESASVRVTMAEELCADLGRRILLVEQQALMVQSPASQEKVNGESLQNNTDITAENSLNGRQSYSNLSRTSTSMFPYISKRPESLNGSVISPLKSSRSGRQSQSRTTKSTILSQARARENVLYGKSWGKPLETSRAEIDSPPPIDSSSDDKENYIGDNEDSDIQEQNGGNSHEDGEKRKFFPTSSILSQSMIVMRQQKRPAHDKHTQKTTQSLSEYSMSEQPFSPRHQILTSVIHEGVYPAQPPFKSEQNPSVDVRQESAPFRTQPLSLKSNPSETELKASLPTAMTQSRGPEPEINKDFEVRLANLEAELKKRPWNEMTKNPVIDNAEKPEEIDKSNTAVALELHAEMSTAAALEMALLRDKLRETTDALLLLRQEVASLSSRGVSPVIDDDDDDDNERKEENIEEIDAPYSRKNDSEHKLSQSIAQTAASALLRCSELEGRLTAAKLEGQLKEQRWISSVQSAQLGVVFKVVNDCVVALAPKIEKPPSSFQRISHEVPHDAVGSKRRGADFESYLQHAGGLRQAYWPNERSLFQRPCWVNKGREVANSPKRPMSTCYSRDKAKESTEKELKDVIGKLRNTLAAYTSEVNL
jgi:hypothetical protein